MISVNPETKTYQFNYDYYVLKHVSHYVKPGAKLLTQSGDFKNILSFVNPDKSIAVILQNDSAEQKLISIKLGDRIINALLESDSFNTLLIDQK